MDMQNILIFALVGAVCMFIVTGGLISMTTDAEPTPTGLGAGAAVGGTLGAALAMMNSDMPKLLDGFIEHVPEMKVGLPAF